MSEQGKQNEDLMITQLIELEEQKLRAAGGGQGLPAAKIDAVKARLMAEKDAILNDFENSSPLRSTTKSNRAKIWSAAAVALLVVGAGLVLFLQRTRAGDAKVIVAYGSVTAGGKAVSAGSVIRNNTPIATQEKTIAVLSQGDAVLIGLGARADVVAQRSESQSDLGIVHRNGIIFAQVQQNRVELKISTPAAVVTVTGTAFSTEVSGDATTVRVLEGAVETRASEKFLLGVRDPAERERLMLPVKIRAGQKVRVSATTHEINLSPLADAEQKYLQKFQRLLAMGPEAPKDPQFEALIQEITAAETAMKTLNQNATPSAHNLTLADIRAKYGKVSKVNLKSGKSYVGFFTLQGAQMQIITPYGTVRVPTAELQDVQDMN